VMRDEPDWSRLPPETPAGIRRLLKRCLRKERARRLHDIVDARIEIEELRDEPDTVPGPPSARSGLLWALGAALALVTAVAAVQSVRLWSQAAPPVAGETRLEIPIPSGPLGDVGTAAMSPDGRMVAYRSTSGREAQLFLRSFDSVTPRPLRGTANATFPFWSPDGRSLGFFADGRLKRIDLDGGATRVLADAGLGRGGAWSDDGTIVFAPLFSGPLLRVSANGGSPSEATRLVSGQVGHEQPQFLPDGRHLLYKANGPSEVSGIYVSSLGGSDAVRITDAQAAAFHSVSGRMLFIRQNELFSQPFDRDRLVLTGNPTLVTQPASGVAVSNAGPIAYHAASPAGQRQFTWFDRAGRELSRFGEPDTNAGSVDPALSPDGSHVALNRTIDGNSDIWLLETDRGVFTRFTSEAASNFAPRWSPDGKTLVFNSNRSGLFELWTKPVGAAGGEERLLATSQNISATDWSHDGRFLLFRSVDPVTSHDLWALPLAVDRKPFPIVRTQFIEPYGRFAPDGRWVAYQSNESGRPEVYVQSFPSPGGKVRISTNGGTQLVWRRDGRELYYRALDNTLMAVPIRPSAGGDTLEPGAPVPLFKAGGGPDPAVALNGNGLSFDVDPDGSRFLINETVEDTPATSIVVILNWKPRE
jgi:Tol biopolymer transport system component